MEEKEDLINEPTENSTTDASTTDRNGLAIAGFVVAIVSLFINFGGIVGLVATILSAIGLSKVKTTNKGKGLAIAGLIIGIISIIYGIFTIIVLVTTTASLLSY